MKFGVALALALVVASAAEVRAQAGNFTSTYVARWNLTHGKYQVDIGEYLDALEAFNTAIEMADDTDVRTDALLQKANVLAVFLDESDDAIRVYDDLLTQYPKSTAAEAAVFRAAMVLFDGEQYGRAAGYFERYLKEYPNGPSHGSAEFLLAQARSKSAAAPTAVAPSPARAAPSPTSTAPLVIPTAPPVIPTAQPLPRATPPATRAAHPPTPVPLPPTPLPPPSITQVRVRIMKGHDSVRIASDGPLTVKPPLAAGPSIDLTARAGLVVVGTQPGVREVTIAADQPLQMRAGGAPRRYRGSLTVQADGTVLRFVNHVGIEEYLYGVVTKESGASWPLEALKAQAVASRTYALYQMQHRQDRDYDMVDDEGSQVYGGVEGESDRGRRAVEATRGMTLAYRGRTIYAMFTANTGWYTGDPAYIFDQPLPYLAAAPDPYSPGEQMGRWTRKYSEGEIRRKLSDIGVQLGTIHAIEPRVTCPSGRIVRVDLVDEHGSHVMRTRPTLGRALNLPEILLTVQHSGDQFIFAGGGFGHGVGLSQWGAKDMADKGMNVKDILAFYYRGAEITTAAP